MKEYFISAKNWVSKIIPFSLPIKIIIGSLFGSGLLGLLSEFATYFYAISYGFRPPVEGIPYLSATVTFISIIVILGAFIGFIIIYSLLKMLFVQIETSTSYIFNYIFNYIFSKIKLLKNNIRTYTDTIDKMRENSTLYLIIISILSASVLGVIFTFLVSQKDGFDLWVFIGIFLFASIVYFIMFRPASIKYIAVAAVLAYIVLVPSMMFHTDTYGKFMRISGFGGGKEVSVFYNNLSKDSPQTKVSGGLLIRTAKFIIIYKVENDEIIEIPISNVIKITYKNCKSYSLPKKIVKFQLFKQEKESQK